MSTSTQTINRHTAAIEHAARGHQLTINLAVDPWVSPVGYSDSSYAFQRDLDQLKAALLGTTALHDSGFSTRDWASEWFHMHGDAPCTVWTDSDGYVLMGKFDPCQILERLIGEVYDDCHGQIDNRMLEADPASGYWLLRNALWNLSHPCLGGL